MSKRETAAASAPYDYVLVAGPGRSGSTFLYRLLRTHPAFRAPAIKEGYYYRSARRFQRARRRLRGSGAMLLDVANTAWADPRLDRVAELRRRGHRILVVLLLRRHRERAVSVMEYRQSRIPGALFAGRPALEGAALRDSLTAAALRRVFGLGTDVLTIGFDALAADPRGVLDVMARLCATPRFATVATVPVNESVRATHPLLAAAGKLAAVALRAAGAHRLLQALKDQPRVVRLFFRPRAAEERIALSAGAGALLDRQYEACVQVLEATGERIGDGLWFASGERPGQGAAADSSPEP